jgi:ABC-type polysaccharide/polyol phosphate transport system ATPase subunit
VTANGRDDLAIEVTTAGKRYVKYDDAPMLVSHLLQLRSRTRRSALWALRGASFDVRKGECVGVVGRNGSGKSTLLHLLAGVTAPTEGRVTVQGRVAPLISVGVGFHPELTGRENVYVNATILGLRREEIDRRFDEIASFAEIGEFLETPVKFYSSGMFVRLGFAVSAMSEPDVLLIDEVLAVGDLAFQLKCFERLERLRESGATVVLVTHNLNAVRRLCERTLVIHNGELRHDGDTVEALSLYHELLGEDLDLDDAVAVDEPVAIDAGELSNLRLLGPDGEPTRHAATGDTLTLEATITLRQRVADAILGLNVVTEGGVRAYGENWRIDDLEGWDGAGPLRIRLSFCAAMATGSYSIHLSLGSPRHAGIAPPAPPILFFVTGRNSVAGIVDLATTLDTLTTRDGA